MKNIACSILCVGLCFYQVYRRKTLGTDNVDIAASLFSIAGAIGVFLV